MYKEHHDASVYYNRKMNRMITFIIYLNDVEEGGETDFFRGNIKIKMLKNFISQWVFSNNSIFSFWACGNHNYRNLAKIFDI